MKRLQVLFLVALSSSLLLFGCGDKDDDAIQPVVVEPIVEVQPETQEEGPDKAEETEDETDLPPAEGAFGGRLGEPYQDPRLVSRAGRPPRVQPQRVEEL